jgi:GT2 family glycosyltransferase
MGNPLVITVILNTNKREDTLACLASLAKTTYPNLRNIVLDNASTDGSAEAIRQQFPDAHLVSLTQNLGYAGNNNVGIQAALEMGADWVFVLNEDTLLDPDCISKLVEVGESDGKIGVLGPLVYHADEPSVIQSAGGVITPQWDAIQIGMNEDDRGQYAQPMDVGYISGCGILVRSNAIKQNGMIDARYFYYWEETEWCIRLNRAGWRIVNVPAAKMWHKGVQRHYNPKPSVAYYAVRNRLATMRKHHAPLAGWAGALSQTLRTVISYTVRPKWQAKREFRDAMWRGLVDFAAGRWGKMPA